MEIKLLSGALGAEIKGIDLTDVSDENFKKINDLRHKASSYYHKNLQNIPGIILPDMKNDKSHSYHLYTIRIKTPYKLSRNQLFKN